jgi:cell wall-associated NlpC family hydrolase
MTLAELSSTSEPGTGHAGRTKHSLRPLALVGLAASLGAVTVAVSVSLPASADQISDAKAQAAAIDAKIQAIDAQRQQLTGQVTQADYQLSQLKDQIAAGQAEIAKDQAEVNKDQSQLRTQAISDYVSSGTSNQVTQMFTSNVNTSGIRSEYTSIATGNVTDTVDHLHTAQAQLQVTQTALVQHQTQATATRNSLVGAENQAASLAGQYQSTLDSVNSNIQKLVEQQQAARAAAAKAAQVAAFNAKLAAAQAAQTQQSARSQSTPTAAAGGGGGSGGGTGGGGGPTTVTITVLPPLASGAAGAVQAAESQIGVPYVWAGESPRGTPGEPLGGFDCSGLVAWAYAQVGIGLPHFSGAQYADTTHIPFADIEPGDLLFYGPGGSDHVAMYVGGGSMIEAPYTGASVWITGVRTDFAAVGRVA